MIRLRGVPSAAALLSAFAVALLSVSCTQPAESERDAEETSLTDTAIEADDLDLDLDAIDTQAVLEPFDAIVAANASAEAGAGETIDWGSELDALDVNGGDDSDDSGAGEVAERSGLSVLGCSLANVAGLASCLNGKLSDMQKRANEEAQRIYRDSRTKIAAELQKAQAEATARLSDVRTAIARANGRQASLEAEVARLRAQAAGAGTSAAPARTSTPRVSTPRVSTASTRARVMRRGAEGEAVGGEAGSGEAGDGEETTAAVETIEWDEVLAPYTTVAAAYDANAAPPTGVAERGGFQFPPLPSLPSPSGSGSSSSDVNVLGCKLSDGPAGFKSCLEGKVNDYRRNADQVVADALAKTRRDLEQALNAARQSVDAALRQAQTELSRANAAIAQLQRQADALRAEIARKAGETTGAIAEGVGSLAGPSPEEKAAAWDRWLRSAGARRPFAFDANEQRSPPSVRGGYLLSLLSWIAYAPPAKARQTAESWGLRVVDEMDIVQGYGLVGALSGSTQAIILQNDSAVFVAFQGSTTNNLAQDWLDNDLDFKPLPMLPWGAGVVLHQGFYEAMGIAYDRVRDRIRPLVGGRRLWITGHSLGGAIAFLFAFRLEQEAGIGVTGVHTYGAPPVGNGAWARVYNARIPNTHRWNIERDPVPVLYQAPAFYHVGSTNNIYASGRVIRGDQRMFGYVPGPGSLNDLSVTHMDYWWRLEAALDARERDGLPTPPDRIAW